MHAQASRAGGACVVHHLACAAAQAVAPTKQAYVSIRMSGGAPVVVTTMDTLAELRRSAHQAVHILAERRGPSAERVEVSCQRWRVSLLGRAS